jgi:hypothetical protein
MKATDMTTIKYQQTHPVVRNLNALSHGTGCKYLLCIRGEGQELVAKAWKRKLPATLSPGEVIVEF